MDESCCGHSKVDDVKSVSSEVGRIYTCPMHPEIRHRGPGTCPTCGIALEPLETTVDEGENHELKSMTRRFWASMILTLPILALTMGSMLWGHFVSARVSIWLQCALATPVLLWGGWPFFERFWLSI